MTAVPVERHLYRNKKLGSDVLNRTCNLKKNHHLLGLLCCPWLYAFLEQHKTCRLSDARRVHSDINRKARRQRLQLTKTCRVRLHLCTLWSRSRTEDWPRQPLQATLLTVSPLSRASSSQRWTVYEDESPRVNVVRWSSALWLNTAYV